MLIIHKQNCLFVLCCVVLGCVALCSCQTRIKLQLQMVKIHKQNCLLVFVVLCCCQTPIKLCWLVLHKQSGLSNFPFINRSNSLNYSIWMEFIWSYQFQVIFGLKQTFPNCSTEKVDNGFAKSCTFRHDLGNQGALLQ